MKIHIIGGGLAGAESAWACAKKGVEAVLYEMRPSRNTPVHKTPYPAELVCSNSLGSNSADSAPGILKEELRMLGSLIMESADKNRVPAGQALAVDRNAFSLYIDEKLRNHPLIEIKEEEVTSLSFDGITIIATGPMTSPPLAEEIQKLLGKESLYFFDAVSPIVTAESLNMDRIFVGDRYGKGTGDYLNCPMNKEEFRIFYKELINAERVQPPDFEKNYLFDGCMPIEEIADRGEKTLLFGPLKPVGLSPDSTAVIQLRKENRDGTLYNLVGFQTRLKWGEQKRVFRLIPGLENADFIRYGVMHKNIYIHSPSQLDKTLQLKINPHILMAGQITGVEGYMESTAMGLMAGINAVRLIKGESPVVPPLDTAIGSLIHHITDENIKNFQPMNINFGILPSVKIEGKRKPAKKEKHQTISGGCIRSMKDWINRMAGSP